MFDIIISDLPVEEPAADMGSALQLLLALGGAFLALLVLLWLTILLARYIRNHASKIRTSLGETTAVSQKSDENKGAK